MEIMRLLFIFLSSLLLSSVSVSASSYVPAIFTFGDSIFDAGNNRFNKNCSAQADFPPYGSSFFHHPTGRFTNGRTVADFISQFVGIGFQKPYLEAYAEVVNGSQKNYPSNGINFASAGSGILQETNKHLGVISMQEQVQQFEKLVLQNQIDRNLIQKSLFLFESGSNDIFNYFAPSTRPTTLDPDSYVQSMLTEVSRFFNSIYNLGARRIAMFNLGPVGCVPARALLRGAPINRCFGKMNVMVKKYNMGLETMLKDYPRVYRPTVVAYGAVYKIVQELRSVPNQYGFTEVSAACCGAGTLGGMQQCGKDGYKICKNPNEFLFWDSFHPTEHAYEFISKALWAGGTTRIRPVNLMTLANITSN
ncbi:hypothetical protein L6164_001638 [Bauhinia variegata]|uniref:Uncharacterized protein n=1 Tax=Bauhinia variegata TaxID=167791 RepID=A0ACB9Q9E2_BAUVA|nr:hypothetical protein L6164_001638 [Bauhinia variegata]